MPVVGFDTSFYCFCYADLIHLACPMINYWLSVNFFEIQIDTIHRFLLGFNPNAPKHLPCRQIVSDFSGFVRRIVVAKNSDIVTFGIFCIKLLEQLDKVGAFVSLAYMGNDFSCKQAKPCEQRLSSKAFVFRIPHYTASFSCRTQILPGCCHCLNARLFIAGYCMHHWLIRRNIEISFFLERHADLLVYNQNNVRFGLKLRISFLAIISDLDSQKFCKNLTSKIDSPHNPL